jgi:hypothetical protein
MPRMRSLLLAVLCACSGGGVKDIKDTPKNATGPTCHTAGQHLTELVVSMQKKPPPDDAVNAQIDKTAKVCEDGKWSAPAIECFSKIKTVEEADACTKHLSEEQLNTLAGGDAKEPEAPAEGAAPGGADGGGAPPTSEDPDAGGE